MMNKAINTLVLATVDSLTKFKNKLAYYLAIFAMVFGSTFGTMNAAYAGAQAVADDATVVVGTHADYGSGTAVVTISSGTDAGSDGFVATFNAANEAVNFIKMTSITDEDETHDPTVTIDNGRVQVSTHVIGIAASAGDVFRFAVTGDGVFAIGGNVTHASNKTVTMTLAGAGTVEAYGAGVQAFANTILSTSDDAGVLAIKDGGLKTFNGVIGATELGVISTTASGSAEFNAAVDAKVVTNLGTAQFDAATGINTLTNSGTVSINHAIDNVEADGLASIVMHTTGSILNFNDGTTRDHDMVITGTTDGFGTINVIDSAGGAAAAQVTSGGDIGAAAIHIGTINIGSATAAGALTTLNGDEIHVDTLNIIGGDATTENSILIAAEHVIANTGIVLTAADAGDAELNVSTAATITGDITVSGVDGAGDTIIDVDNATTFVGSIGDSTASVEIMTVATGTATLKGATNAVESLAITGDGITVDFLGTVAQTFTGAITTATDDHAILTNSNVTETVTFTGLIGAEDARMKEITLADNTDTTFNSAVSALDLDINTAAADDVTTFAVGGHVIGDNGTLGGALEVAGGTFVLGTAIVDGVTVFDTKEVVATDAGVELRALVIQPSANFTSGTVTFIDGATAASVDAADVLGVSITDTALTDFTVNITAAVADVTITAAAKSGATTGTALGVTTNEGTAIHQLMASAIASDATVLTALNDNLTSVNGGVLSVATDLAKQTAPQTDTIGGSAVATRAMTGTVQGIVSNRMASLRSGDAFVTGMSAGNGMSANSGFIQAFGSQGEQKNTKKSTATVYGFDTDTSGLAIGFDGMTDNGSTIGLSASYSATDVDGKGTGKSKNSIDSYTVSVYADKATDIGYIEGSLTYGINDNTASRIVNTAGLNRTYSANYDSEQISLKVGGGVPNEVADGTFVTPFMTATVTNITTDAYTEKSTTANDALRLKIAQDDINSLVGSLGVKAHMVTDKGTPMISLAVNNEFGDTTINSANTYQGGGTKFTTSTDVEELSATLGLGYSFGNDVTSLNINYEANVNDDEYLNQYGSIKIVAKF